MTGEIIAIGDELTSGRILNTNSYFAAGQLFAAGHEIIAMATVGDTPAEIGAVLKRAVKRSEFIIVTGGLGATSDDLTNEAVSQAFDRPSTLYPRILEKIKSRLAKTPGSEKVTLEKLAWLPEGAEVLKPEARMAGYLLVHEGRPIFFLPGVPHEMHELLAERVIPRLASWAGGAARVVKQRTYKICGLPEIEINRIVSHLEDGDPRIRIGYYPVLPEVHLSLTVMDDSSSKVERLFGQFAAEIETCLGDYVFGRDDETMEGVIGRLLSEQKKTMAVAESCTGGLVAHRLTRVPGSSAYFKGGVVAYSNDMKERFLDVDSGILSQHGAVSAPVARAMAAGLLRSTGADICVAVTGIAGPDGGSGEKPVGTVFFGLATRAETVDFKKKFSGSRWQIQEMTALCALDIVRRLLLAKL